MTLEWLTGDWRTFIPHPWVNGVLVLDAVVCGVIIGIERERKKKAVGVRTLSLVSLGSTVFTLIAESLNHRTPIAGQIITGIGFLGAGVILRGPFGIVGLTSAGTIWAMAAVGMTIGIGYGGAGLLLSIFLLASLLALSIGESHYIGQCQVRPALVVYRADGGKTLIKIEEVLDEYRFSPKYREYLDDLLTAPTGPPQPCGQLLLHYCDVHRHHREFLAFLAGMPEILEIRRGPVEPSASSVDFTASATIPTSPVPLGDQGAST